MGEKEGITSRRPSGLKAAADEQGRGELRGDEIAAAAPPSARPGAAAPPVGDAGWFLLCQGTSVGPFTVEELKANAAAGTLGAEDLVRKGNGSWVPAKDVAVLERHYRAGGGATSGGPGKEQAVGAGIGGWLILPAIGLVLGLLAMVWAICQDFIWLDRLAGAASGIYGALIAEIVLNGGLFLFQGYVAFAFFSRRRATPALMIVLLLTHLLASIVITVIVASAVGPSPETAFGILRPVLAAAIWIPYFLRSRRVEATFVN